MQAVRWSALLLALELANRLCSWLVISSMPDGVKLQFEDARSDVVKQLSQVESFISQAFLEPTAQLLATGANRCKQVFFSDDLLQTEEIALARPVRLLHPRVPVYIVPRGGGLFMVGATMIETDFDGPITARSLMELLNAAYALHPAFAEATVIETGAGIRPAFPDNFPRVTREGKTTALNGLYRHGFLLAPTMAVEVADLVLSGQSDQRSSKCA